VYLTGGNERIAGNLAVSLSGNGGYGTNAYHRQSDEARVDRSFVGRSKLVWRPDAALKVTVAADYQDLDQDLAARSRDRIPADRPAAAAGCVRRQPRHAEPLPLPLRRRLAQGGRRTSAA
jgi:hypothetical protein